MRLKQLVQTQFAVLALLVVALFALMPVFTGTAHAATNQSLHVHAKTQLSIPMWWRENDAVSWANSNLGSQAWDNYCELFVENAFGTSGQYASAQANYNGGTHYWSWPPPYGALVFFAPNSSNEYVGHVGLYTSNGNFISATSYGVAVYNMTYWSNNIAPYEGWEWARSSWPGR